jgi:hypothetical protein
MTYSRLNEYDSSISMYDQAIQQDEYFAVAYLQKGFSLFMLEEYDKAEKCFKFIYYLLLENDFIYYEQLGMKYKLYRCEVMFNMAMCYHQLGYYDFRDQFVKGAKSNARTSEHKLVIEPWTKEKPGSLIIFTLPLGTLFKLSEAKLKNLDKKTFITDAKLVLNNRNSGFLGFSGAKALRTSLSELDGTISRAAREPNSSNAKKPNVGSNSSPNGHRVPFVDPTTAALDDYVGGLKNKSFLDPYSGSDMGSSSGKSRVDDYGRRGSDTSD